MSDQPNMDAGGTPTAEAGGPAPTAADELEARAKALEEENAELRAELARRERPSRQLELITQDEQRRTRVAKLMLAGGAITILIGVFSSSWFAIICGLGWLFGGGAVASTVPQSGGDS